MKRGPRTEGSYDAGLAFPFLIIKLGSVDLSVPHICVPGGREVLRYTSLHFNFKPPKTYFRVRGRRTEEEGYPDKQKIRLRSSASSSAVPERRERNGESRARGGAADVDAARLGQQRRRHP